MDWPPYDAGVQIDLIFLSITQFLAPFVTITKGAFYYSPLPSIAYFRFIRYLCRMTKDFQHISQLIADCQVDEAIKLLSEDIDALDVDQRAHAYYLLGNAYGNLANWRCAISCYCHSTELVPDGPAAEAYRRAIEILDFYNHDLYNP